MLHPILHTAYKVVILPHVHLATFKVTVRWNTWLMYLMTWYTKSIDFAVTKSILNGGKSTHIRFHVGVPVFFPWWQMCSCVKLKKFPLCSVEWMFHFTYSSMILMLLNTHEHVFGIVLFQIKQDVACAFELYGSNKQLSPTQFKSPHHNTF